MAYKGIADRLHLEKEWRDSRDSLGTLFLSVAIPLTISTNIEQPSLIWLKMAIFFALGGVLISIVQRRWSYIVAVNSKFKNVARPFWLWFHKNASSIASILLLLATLFLIVAVSLR